MKNPRLTSSIQKDFQRRGLTNQLEKAQDFPSRQDFATFWNMATKCPALVREIANFDLTPRSMLTTEEALEIFDIELIRKLHSK